MSLDLNRSYRFELELPAVPMMVSPFLRGRRFIVGWGSLYTGARLADCLERDFTAGCLADVPFEGSMFVAVDVEHDVDAAM